MQIPFAKYQGTGNDFVLVDQRSKQYIIATDEVLVKAICDRRFGIGADGLILLQNKAGYDFEMVYFNSDGRPSSMCGNGGRCIVAFAQYLGIIEKSAKFLAIDGGHEALIIDEEVQLKMADVPLVNSVNSDFQLNTGSPHYVTFVEDIDDIRVIENAQAIRYAEAYKEEGINVNFVEAKDEELIVFTYERGVEGETLSCGTGVTAAALAYHRQQASNFNEIAIRTKGGNLKVRFMAKENGYADIWLCGPATRVFAGNLDRETVGQRPTQQKYFS